MYLIRWTHRRHHLSVLSWPRWRKSSPSKHILVRSDANLQSLMGHAGSRLLLQKLPSAPLQISALTSDFMRIPRLDRSRFVLGYHARFSLESAGIGLLGHPGSSSKYEPSGSMSALPQVAEGVQNVPTSRHKLIHSGACLIAAGCSLFCSCAVTECAAEHPRQTHNFLTPK